MGYDVISFFDGICCGKLALERAGVQIDNYYAFEIDKDAIRITRSKHPKVVQCGSVTDASYSAGWLKTAKGVHKLGKNIIFMGGSPCQGFSYAGVGLNFTDPRSSLFFEWLRVLYQLQFDNNINLKFLLENVKMKRDFIDAISEMVGVEPVMINSSLVSAQNRERYYWCNWSVRQPEERGIVLRDILMKRVPKEYYLTQGELNYMAGDSGEWSSRQAQVNDLSADKSRTITATYAKGVPHNVATTPVMVGHAGNINGDDFIKRVYSPDGKSPTLTAICGGNQEPKVMDGKIWRKLMPIECERLQTLPDDYTQCVIDSSRYHGIGNGWNVETVAHVFKEANL